jgi:hypothetical protein
MMGLFTGLVLLALGVLAAASSIVARRPDAQVYIDKLVPYQGWLGFLSCLWGIWIIINAIVHLDWITFVPGWWVTYASSGMLNTTLGLLLGYALLTKFIFSHSMESARRGEQVRLRIVPYQVMLGYCAIALGTWTILVTLFFYRI